MKRKRTRVKSPDAPSTFNSGALRLQVRRFPSRMEKIQIYRIQLKTNNNSNSLIHSIQISPIKIKFPQNPKKKKIQFQFNNVPVITLLLLFSLLSFKNSKPLMHEADNDPGFGPCSRSAKQMSQMPPPPALVSLNAFRSMPSPSPRRLSSNFKRPSEPVSRRNLAWVSLEGRLVNADKASSARAVKGGLSREEAVAWELFSPIQRFLIVAVIGVAAAESKKNRLISQLTKSVEFRVCDFNSSALMGLFLNCLK